MVGHTLPAKMDQTVLKVLAQEVQRRKCPNCGNPLRSASISAGFLAADRVGLHFRCAHCVFEGGGEIELTPEIYREAEASLARERRAALIAEPISGDELIHVHEILAGWNQELGALFAL